MQNRGLIRLFAILFGIVSIYQLSFTFITNKLEKEAAVVAESKVATSEENYAEKREEIQKAYLDSLSKTDVFFGYTFKEVQDKQLNKGLDLKGGINVILQISVKDILKGLVNNPDNAAFKSALAAADEASKNSDATYLELFYQSFEKGTEKLASPDLFYNKSFEGEIEMGMENSQVKSIITTKVNESVNSAFDVLRRRIDKFGVVQPNIQRLGESGRILVELPGAKDIDRVKNLLQSTAQLEFWETYTNIDVFEYLANVNEKLKETLKNEEPVVVDEAAQEEIAGIDSLLTNAATDSLEQESNPLYEVFGPTNPNPQAPQNIIGYASVKDTAIVNNYLNGENSRKLLPRKLRYVKFIWSRPEENTDIVSLYAIKGNRNNAPEVSGDVVVAATDDFDPRGNPAVEMRMNGVGAKAWETLTGKAFNNGTAIAIVLDNTVYSAPGVTTGPISGGVSSITGQFTIAETKDLANILRAGKLPARADIIQSTVVGPSLGQEAINAGFMSFAIAMVIVLFWMIFYYGKAGIFSDIALLFNVLLIFGALASLGAVLTLPGIAGIVLTIGMAVDANVIIYERIKEEMALGKPIKEAINDGFSNALSSILDANITTGLTAIILLVFGTGPIQGFATTLLIGILTSLFTAIFVTRLMVEAYVGAKNRYLAFYTGATKNLFSNINVDFLSKRKIAYIISSVLVVVGLISLFTNGLDQGVDFVGGRTYQVRFEQPVNATEISSELSDVFGSASAKTAGGDNQIKVTTKYKVDVDGSEVDTEIQEKLFTALQKYLPEGTTYETFVSADDAKKVGIMESIKVGPTIADDIKQSAIWAIFGSLAVVFLYILLRFRRWQFSLGAVAAVFHDVLLVLGVFSLTYSFMPFSMEVDQAFIAAILTVIGYSLNDTVIVFDRIREITSEYGWNAGININKALNSTLGRTLNTSLTTLIVLIAIFIFGGDSLKGFMFAMIVGILVGTYSSLFIATPVMFDTLKNKKVAKDEEA